MKKTLMYTMLVLSVFSLMTVGTMAKKMASPSLVDVTLSVNGEGSQYEGMFDTLIAGVLAADPIVLDTLSYKGQHTVFAPTDEAFMDLGITPDNIASLDKETLTEILLYHVANGRRDAADITTSDKVRMLNKEFVDQDGAVLTDNQGGTANIIDTDVEADNGIIHVIDSVLMQ